MSCKDDIKLEIHKSNNEDSSNSHSSNNSSFIHKGHVMEVDETDEVRDVLVNKVNSLISITKNLKNSAKRYAKIYSILNNTMFIYIMCESISNMLLPSDFEWTFKILGGLTLLVTGIYAGKSVNTKGIRYKNIEEKCIDVIGDLESLKLNSQSLNNELLDIIRCNSKVISKLELNLYRANYDIKSIKNEK